VSVASKDLRRGAGLTIQNTPDTFALAVAGLVSAGASGKSVYYRLKAEGTLWLGCWVQSAVSGERASAAIAGS